MFSLFHLIEEIHLDAAQEANIANDTPVLPLELHTYWELEPEEIGEKFEFQVIQQSDGQELAWDKTFELAAETPRHRLRIAGLKIMFSGVTHLTVQWRRAGEADWNTSPYRWPLTVSATGGQAHNVAAPAP